MNTKLRQLIAELIADTIINNASKKDIERIIKFSMDVMDLEKEEA